VGFDHDRTKDNQRLGLSSKKGKGWKEKPEMQQKLDDEEYFDADDALAMSSSSGSDLDDSGEHDDDEDGEYLRFDLAPLDAQFSASAVPDPGTRSGAERAKRVRQALLSEAEVAPARRAELLELLEDLGPEGLLPPPKMPGDDLEDATATSSLLQEDLSRNLTITRSFIDSVALRESGALAEGAYFGYLLNTRRVSKSQAEGKRTSYSTLVVVGNGKGTAGIGMGKDTTAGVALYKATVAARKNLIHVERFDERTLFHAMDERFAKTKLVVRLRRPGSGTRCSWVVWKMLSAFGITDVSVKIHGSRNPTTVAHAVMNALQRSSSAQSVADRRGLRILDMDPKSIRVPGY